MSTKNTNIHTERLKILKNYGLLRDIDGRRTLDASTKQKIRRQYKKYADVLDSPKSNFSTVSASLFNKAELKDINKSGYKKIADKIYINKEGFDKAKIVKDKKTNKIKIIRGDNNRRKKETEYIVHGRDSLELRDRLLQEYVDGRFKKDDFIGLKLFNNGHFKRSIFTNMTDVNKYAVDFVPKDDYANLEMLQRNMKLVKISVRDIADIETNKTKPKTKPRTKKAPIKKASKKK